MNKNYKSEPLPYLSRSVSLKPSKDFLESIYLLTEGNELVIVKYLVSQAPLLMAEKISMASIEKCWLIFFATK